MTTVWPGLCLLTAVWPGQKNWTASPVKAGQHGPKKLDSVSRKSYSMAIKSWKAWLEKLDSIASKSITTWPGKAGQHD